MNIIIKALDTIRFNIPSELLKVAFLDNVRSFRNSPTNLNEAILTTILRPRVLIDANLVGGEEVIVDLDGVPHRNIDNYSVVYEIPTQRINYRSLMNVLSVGYGQSTSTNYAPFVGADNNTCSGPNEVLKAATRVGDSLSSVPNVSTAKASIVGENTVVIYDQAGIAGFYVLRCLVANEENLNNISPRSFIPFSELCVHAVKSYIYNNLIVKLDNAYLSGGQELGAIRNLVESYSDAEENYMTYLSEVWTKTAYMNDTIRHDRFIKMQLNSAL